MATLDETLESLGRSLRAARRGLHQLQSDIGRQIDVSQPTISRMELGRGSGVPVATWAAAAEAVGLRLSAGLDPPDVTSAAMAFEQRCHELVIEEAWRGAWSAVTSISRMDPRSPAHIETVLVRNQRAEMAILLAWPSVTSVERRIRAIEDRLAMEREVCGDDHVVSVLVVVPSTRDNRRRMTESRVALAPALPAAAGLWHRALINEQRRMPERPGVLWLDRHLTRIMLAPLLAGWIWTAPGRGPSALVGPKRLDR